MSFLRQCPRSPAAPPPLEDDDLLSEILLRLPPQPSSLPRASAVCKRWRSLVSDPRFIRRFRRHHCRNPPPLLGFFTQSFNGIAFQPTMEAPDRVPAGRFSMPSDAHLRFRPLGCRHGLMLVVDQNLGKAMVWDPVAGDQHYLAFPPGFAASRTTIVGTVLRAVGDAHHFQVVLARLFEEQQPMKVFACIYSSETGVWGDLISTLLPSGDSMYITSMGAVLSGCSLYWMLTGNSRAIIELDLGRQSLAVIHLPVDKFAHCKPWDITVMQTEGGGLGLLFMSDLTAQLWKRNTDCGVASWVLGRTIEVDKLLSLNSELGRQFLIIVGFAESNNVVFLHTTVGLFMVQLKSLQFKKISIPSIGSWYHPFESVYAAGV